MNKSDFQRATGGKKVKLTFSVSLIKGRLNTMEKPPPLARDFLEALQLDDVANKFIRASELEVSLNSSCQLLIKNNTPVAVVENADHGTDPGANAEEAKPVDETSSSN